MFGFAHVLACLTVGGEVCHVSLYPCVHVMDADVPMHVCVHVLVCV